MTTSKTREAVQTPHLLQHSSGLLLLYVCSYLSIKSKWPLEMLSVRFLKSQKVRNKKPTTQSPVCIFKVLELILSDFLASSIHTCTAPHHLLGQSQSPFRQPQWSPALGRALVQFFLLPPVPL